MNEHGTMQDFNGKELGYPQLQNILHKMIGKKVRFSLKSNGYNSIVGFEAVLAGVYPCKQFRRTGGMEQLEWVYRIENDKGVEIYFPVQKLMRIDEPDNCLENNYFLIFERHYWSLEVLTG